MASASENVPPATSPQNGRLAALRDSTFRSLRHRNYRLFFFGQLGSLVGTWMQNVAQSWLVWELTHSSVWLGVIGFLTFLPQLLFSMVGGLIADRYAKRSLIIVMQSMMMVQAFVLAALVWTGWITAPVVATMAFLLGVANSFDMPARQAFVVEMVGREDVTNAIGLNSAVFNGARLVGPAIGGVLIHVVGTSWCFFLNGVSFLAVIAGLFLMRLPKHETRHMGRSALRSMRDGLRFIRGERTVLGLMILVATLTVFGWSYSVLLPVFADTVLHAGSIGLGNMLSANGLGALCSALLVASVGERLQPKRVVSFAVAGFLIGVVVFAISTVFILSLAALFTIGLSLTSFFATANSTFQHRSPDALRGRVMGVYAVVFGGFYPFGSLEVGWLAKVIGPSATILLNAALCLLVILIVRRIMRVAPNPPAVEDIAEPDVAVG